MTLYAARGGNVSSDLYILDPSDASETVVGNTGHALTGLAFDPTDGTLYGSTSNNSPSNARSLVTVDPLTGTTTLVGGFGIGSDTLADIAFDSNGVLYGYSATGHKLHTVNLGTGAATQVSATTIVGGAGFGMDFDSEDNLFVLPDGDDLSPASDILLVDQTDASHELFSSISGSPPYGNGAPFSAGTFAPGKIFYAIDNDFGATTHLVTVDMSTGEVVDIGSVTAGMDALASDTRATEAWIYSFDATTIINPDSPGATVVSGRVREPWLEWFDNQYSSDGMEPTFKFTWNKPKGMYKVRITGRAASSPVRLSTFFLVRVNGRMFFGGGFTPPNDGTTDTAYVYRGIAGTVYDDDYERAMWVPLNTGDTVTVMVASGMDSGTPSFTFVPFDTETVSFVDDSRAPESSNCTPSFNWPTSPLGDAWGSPMGWGGQIHVPDEVFTDEGITPYDEGNFAWGINWADWDIQPLADGTVYMAVHDESSGISGSHYVVVKKYDPGSDSWSQIATLDSETDDQIRTEAVSMAADDTYVYVAFWRGTLTSTGPPRKNTWTWHLWRIDPSDDSTTELGTGQNKYGVVNQNNNYDLSVLASKILAISPSNIYVAAVETQDVASPNNDRRMTVWHWNGSTWTDLNCPDPTDANIPAGVYEATGENGFYDQLAAMVAARADGPCTDGFTLVYSYRYVDVSTIVYSALETIFYTAGTGWHDEIITYPVDIEGNNRLNQGTVSEPSRPLDVVQVIDHDVMWNTNRSKLVLAFDLISNVTEIWDVWQLNADGDQWELFDPDFPASSAGPWRQARNVSLIGPDGEIYRAMWSESFGVVNFEPKLIKTSPGYNTGFAMAHRNGAGEGATEDGADRWNLYQYGTTHVPFKIVNGVAYSSWNMYAEGTIYDASGDETWNDSYADAIYVFRHEYVPCAAFRPHFYRRIHG